MIQKVRGASMNDINPKREGSGSKITIKGNFQGITVLKKGEALFRGFALYGCPRTRFMMD